MPAHPLKDALVMNVGDLLQRWSNGKLPFPPQYNDSAVVLTHD